MANVIKEYYDKMGFLNLDSMIYTTALIGLWGGGVGILKHLTISVLADARGSKPTDNGISDLLPYLALTASSYWAAMAGLKKANLT